MSPKGRINHADAVSAAFVAARALNVVTAFHFLARDYEFSPRP